MKEDLSSLNGVFTPERTLILMKTDYSKIETKILELAEKFGENGAFLANHKGETVLSTVYGKSLLTEEPIRAESRYLMPLCCSSMLALCALILIDEGKLHLSDKLSKFIPEFEHADKIAIRHLIAGKSGIRDFYFGEIRRNLDKDEEYSSLSDSERRKKDMELYLRDYSFETVLNSIKGKELEHEPGVSGDFSSSERFFLREIIERVTKTPVSEFIEKEIFEKLGMNVPEAIKRLKTGEGVEVGIWEYIAAIVVAVCALLADWLKAKYATKSEELKAEAQKYLTDSYLQMNGASETDWELNPDGSITRADNNPEFQKTQRTKYIAVCGAVALVALAYIL